MKNEVILFFITFPNDITFYNPIEINDSNVSVTVCPIGTYQSGHACFTADTSGRYEITIDAAAEVCFTPDSNWCYESVFGAFDECGTEGIDTVAVSVSYNTAPIAGAGGGYNKIEWDASQYASGVYFYRLVAGEFSCTRKMILLK